MTRNLEWLIVEQHQDAQLRPIIDALHNGEAVPGYVLEDNVLKYKRTDQVFGTQNNWYRSTHIANTTSELRTARTTELGRF